MRDAISQALKKINSHFGESIFSDTSMFKGALADVLSGTVNEPARNLMNIAIGMNVYTRLKDSSNGNMDVDVNSLANEMSRKYFISNEMSQMAVESIAKLLGYTPKHDTKRTFFVEKSKTIVETMSFASQDWIVLDEQDDKQLIISELVLEDRAYHEPGGDITWENCTLRKYLNNEFLKSFSDAEKSRIIKSPVENKKNLWFGTSGGSDTEDYVFLLSLEDIVQYFGDSGQLNSETIKTYAINDEFNSNRIANSKNGDASSWWLRTPGIRSRQTVNVLGGGLVYGYGASVDSSSIGEAGVRPAMWVKK